MFEVFGVPSAALFGQLLIGLINGAFYALLSLGLAVIFGLLNIINFTHGAQYMMGAFVSWLALHYLGVGYWPSLLIAPLIVGALGMLTERYVLKRIYQLDHLYGLLLTFGLGLIIEGLFRQAYGSSGQPYSTPAMLQGGINLGFMFLPTYRAWVIAVSVVVCAATWYVIERTRLGSYLRAATENPTLVRAFGVKVPLLITLTYGFGVALAALAGVMAAPLYQVSPLMGSNLIIVVFAVVVIGGMGSISGAIISGFALGLIEGLTKVFYPQASNTVIFVIMAVVLMIRPSGLFGRDSGPAPAPSHPIPADTNAPLSREVVFLLVSLALLAPFVFYPTFLMKALCFALFACAFNLLVGFVGLLSFGHAAFFGSASYIAAHAAKVWGLTPELCLLAGTVSAALLGLLFGWLSIRRQGIYFAMVTLALAQMVFFIALQAPFTGGEDGIQAVPRGTMFGLIDLDAYLPIGGPELGTFAGIAFRTPPVLYYVVLAIFLAGFALIYRTIHSPFGQVLKGIRENEARAISVGYRTDRYKLLVFVLSAALAGLAGATKSIVFQLASLTDVHWSMSGEVVLMTLVGGLGTIFGPVVGAFIVITMENYLAPFGSWVTIIQGIIFVACVLLFRRGIVGEFNARRNTWRDRRPITSGLATASQ